MYTGPNPFNRIEAERQQREGQERGEQRSDFNTPLPGRKPSQYRLPVLLGAAGVILLVLGFIIPGWQWLILIGAVLFFVAAFSVGARFLEGSNKGPGQNDLPPPPSGYWPL